MVEYNASFIEPEAVRKIREARDQAVEVPEEQFMSGINQIFGKPLVYGERPKEMKMHKVDLNKALNEYQEIQKSHEKPKGIAYKDWAKMSLE